MASCVLRATGDNFNPTNFLLNSSFTACNIFQKGERKSQSNVWNTSGITIDVSSKDDFSQQAIDAVIFLTTYSVELERLKQFNGLEQCVLDFGVSGKNIFVQSYFFSTELIFLASNFEMSLEISIYS